jgi:tetratricopeptide (TPR) repeat protein
LRLTFDGTAFPRPGYDWLTRIIAHELVHSADPYNKLSADPSWNALIEPRITGVRALLAKEGLTVIMAASLPLSDRRTKLDKKIQQATGLPSAYSGFSTEEAIAEVVSFTLDKDQRYEPPPQMAAFLRKRLLCPVSNSNDPSGSAYREGLRQAAVGGRAAAVAAFSEAVRLDPQFTLAYMERANSRQSLNANAEAVQDFSKAIALSPLYSYIRPYLLTSRGLLLLQTGDVSNAAADCAAALPLKADYYNSLLLCGRVKLAESNFAGAIADLEAAIKVLPSYKAQVDSWLEKARAGQLNKAK